MPKVKIVERSILEAEKLNHLDHVTLFQNGSRAASVLEQTRVVRVKVLQGLGV